MRYTRYRDVVRDRAKPSDGWRLRGLRVLAGRGAGALLRPCAWPDSSSGHRPGVPCACSCRRDVGQLVEPGVLRLAGIPGVGTVSNERRYTGGRAPFPCCVCGATAEGMDLVQAREHLEHARHGLRSVTSEAIAVLLRATCPSPVERVRLVTPASEIARLEAENATLRRVMEISR